MLQPLNKALLILLSLFIVFTYLLALGQSLSLRAAVDDKSGYHLDIFNTNQLLVNNKAELSFQLFNQDLSTVANLPQCMWQKWSGNYMLIALKRDEYLQDFYANLSVAVIYEVVNSNVVNKMINLFQPSMLGIYYILRQTARPAENTQRYITFKHDSLICGFVGRHKQPIYKKRKLAVG